MIDRTQTEPFRDRRDAGRALGEALVEALRGKPHPPELVLGLPRGGVVVAAEVAAVLKIPLDVFLVRKLGVPGHEELAMGALASGGVRVLHERTVRELGVTDAEIADVISREAQELARREALYHRGHPPIPLEGKSLVVVDDGLATGATMSAALTALERFRPKRLVVAIPVAPRGTSARLESEADQVVCLRTPEPFRAVGQWYDWFPQTTDEQVTAALAERGAPAGLPGRARSSNLR